MQHVFWSVNVCMHVFRQSRAVLRIVTLHALLLPPPHSLLPPPPLDFIPLPNVCCASSSFPLVLLSSFLSSSPLVSPVLSYRLWAIPVLTAAIHLQYVFLSSSSVSRAGKGIRSAFPCSVPRGCSLHTCCLSCRSLLCAGGPFPPPEEAGILPHTDIHSPYHGCRSVTSLFLDQQGVCPCSHSCWYIPSPH